MMNVRQVSASQAGDHPRQPGLGAGHDLHSDGQGFVYLTDVVDVRVREGAWITTAIWATRLSVFHRTQRLPLGDHQINYEGHAIRYSRRSNKYHDVSRHRLGDVHVVKPPLDKEGGDEKCDGGQYEAQHPASIAKIGNWASGSRTLSKPAPIQH